MIVKFTYWPRPVTDLMFMFTKKKKTHFGLNFMKTVSSGSVKLIGYLIGGCQYLKFMADRPIYPIDFMII